MSQPDLTREMKDLIMATRPTRVQNGIVIPAMSDAPVAPVAPAAPVAPPPGGATAAPAKHPMSRETYPGLIKRNEAGEIVYDVDPISGTKVEARVKLTAVATDFDPHKHKQLQPSNFQTRVLFYEQKVWDAEQVLDKAKKSLEDVKSGRAPGGNNEKKAAKISQQLALIAKEMGVSAADLLAQAMAQLTAGAKAE